jgi:CBS domain-containing protein
MVTYTKTLREFFDDSKQYSNSDVAIAIALSLFFLVVVALAHRALGNVDPEIVFVALVPLLIVLLISGKLLVNEIQTPAGLKILFSQPLRESKSLKINAKRVNDAIVEADEFNSPNDEIRKRIFDENTHVLSFEVQKKEPYAEEVIEACMDAIVTDPGMTIRYLQFTDRRDRFEGMLKISDCIHNGIVLSAIDSDEISWSILASDINDGSILEYPGTVLEEISIPAHSSAKHALLKMKEYDRNWLPVLSGGRLFGVVSEDQLLRDVILTWMEEGTEDRTASEESTPSPSTIGTENPTT